MSNRVQAFIGLGSNQGDAVGNVCHAIGDLEKLSATRQVNCSSLYRSAPVGYLQQPDFINAVCRIDTGLSAVELLNELQSLEDKAGRRRDGVRWGPRILDLDLLLFGDAVIQSESLVLPHPRMHERAFVLYPLQEISPNQQIPGFGPVARLVASCADQDCEQISEGCQDRPFRNRC